MAHRDPMLALRAKLDARERALEDTEEALESAEAEVARYKVRVDALLAGPAEARAVATAAATPRRRSMSPALVIALVFLLGSALLLATVVPAAFLIGAYAASHGRQPTPVVAPAIAPLAPPQPIPAMAPSTPAAAPSSGESHSEPLDPWNDTPPVEEVRRDRYEILDPWR